MLSVLTSCLILSLAAPFLRAQGNPTASDELTAQIIKREHEVARSLEDFHPIVETYVQILSIRDGDPKPSYDRYYVSLAEFAGGLRALPFKSRQELWHHISEYSDSVKPTTVEYNPSGFVAMAYPDPGTFDLKHYRFQYLATEFLGELRCLVFEMSPSAMRKGGLFKGKIWVEDKTFTIVRFNGFYMGSNVSVKYFHFDSWRVEAKPGQWIPAAIYSQETELPCCGMWKVNWSKIRFKAQTRFWGYDLHSYESREEFATNIADPPSSINGSSIPSETSGPIRQQQIWEKQAEENVSAKLERIGLLSPAGEVDKVLETVVNNIEVTNKLSIDPEVRCRVLLTSNLESAVVGHTIILSRGLIDVLPNETALAAVLAHNLALTKVQDHALHNYAWADQLQFDSTDALQKLRFLHSAEQEEQASSLAQEWLSNSPYRDSLDSVTRFIAELSSASPHIDRLLKANIGDGLYETLGANHRHLEHVAERQATEIRALPLGSRIEIDPWSGSLTLRRSAGREARSKDENIPFEVTPFFLYLRRATNGPEPEDTHSVFAKNGS
jgi:hypothetical protein